MTSINVRIAGANGDGLESSGALLTKVAARNGLHVFAHRGYQSIIRGGHVWYQIRLSEQKPWSYGDGIDILVALNQDAVDYQKSRLKDNAIVIYDAGKADVDALDPKKYRLVPIPLLDIAMKTSGDAIMRNVVAIGAVMGFMGMDIRELNAVVDSTFSKKGQQVVDSNIKAAAAGYNYEGVKKAYDLKGDGKGRYVLDGNTALAMGAYAGGCKFYAAYPMTPATSIMHWFAAHEAKGALFKQAEDEISAIMMTIGAAHAGARAMCGTSGGGFSLMVEALGFAGMMEAPIVVVDSQRTGPSTGLPSKTEQADLLFAMFASQGEFPRIVMSPRTMEECFKAGADALNLAERYQCPVIILMDQYISEHIESVEDFDLGSVKIDRGKIATAGAGGGRFKRYELAADGISPRSMPGMPGLEFVATSYEHDEYGDLVSDVRSGIDEHVEMRRKMNDKRMRKIDTMLKSETIFVPNVVDDGAGYHLVTFGSTTESATEAMEILKQQGISVGLISFNYLLPLDKEKTKRILSGKKLIDVECNFTAQLAQVIMLNTGIEIKNRILKYDGEAITGEELAQKVKDAIANFK
ncbi:2-oxoglutarate synthase subunit KorA [uncultured archaeon]|nr:2-oxoglutarate synthase subunit KorA [uncultured archaeon]